MRQLWALLLVVGCTRPPDDPGEVGTAFPTPRATATTAPDPAPALMAAVDAARLETEVRSMPRSRAPGSPAHAAARALCADRMKSLGYEVELHELEGGANVIGVRPGPEAERVILSAHYDHVVGCTGADDNATGVAVVLEAGRVLAQQRWRRTLVLACWDAEEEGLHGSRAYAARARGRGEPIAIALSLDAIGYASKVPGSQRMPLGFETAFPEQFAELRARDFRGDFLAAVGDADADRHVEVLRRRAGEAGLPILGFALGFLQRLALIDVYRSDHASFWQLGYTAMLLSDTAEFRNPYYHCMGGDDTADTLDYAFLASVARAVVGLASDALEH
jgi:Zn-dependent M28 family amino/carboxypeptidase